MLRVELSSKPGPRAPGPGARAQAAGPGPGPRDPDPGPGPWAPEPRPRSLALSSLPYPPLPTAPPPLHAHPDGQVQDSTVTVVHQISTRSVCKHFDQHPFDITTAVMRWVLIGSSTPLAVGVPPGLAQILPKRSSFAIQLFLPKRGTVPGVVGPKSRKDIGIPPNPGVQRSSTKSSNMGNGPGGRRAQISYGNRHPPSPGVQRSSLKRSSIPNTNGLGDFPRAPYVSWGTPRNQVFWRSWRCPTPQNDGFRQAPPWLVT